MSNENNNEAKVIDMTATENENMVEISAKELNDLQESNANLIAERGVIAVGKRFFYSVSVDVGYILRVHFCGASIDTNITKSIDDDHKMLNFLNIFKFFYFTPLELIL